MARLVFQDGSFGKCVGRGDRVCRLFFNFSLDAHMIDTRAYTRYGAVLDGLVALHCICSLRVGFFTVYFYFNKTILTCV